MARTRSRCFVWLCDHDCVAYVFVGDKNAPQRIWANKQEISSELNDWLCSLDFKPEVSKEHSLLSPTYASQARAFRRQTEVLLKSYGYRVLSDRDRDTIKVPRGRVPVFTPKGWFPSVRKAAWAIGVSPSLVTLHCQDESKPDWKYDTPGAKQHG